MYNHPGAGPPAEAARPAPRVFEVEEVQNVAYYEGRYADGYRHRLDLYLLKGARGYPVVMLVHGGAWTIGDKSTFGLYSAVGRFFARGRNHNTLLFRATGGDDPVGGKCWSSSAVMPAEVVGRLAPSPTGAQHVGNARTYLVAWLSARSRGGRVVLRVEDIDSPRVKPGAAELLREDLRWLGLDWDAGPVVQTERLPLYEAALRRLREQERVYPCTCTRSDVERAASAPHAEHEGPVYPGTCAGRRAADAVALAGRPFAWRFRVPAEAVAFTDGFRGPSRVDLRAVGGDFVVWKSAGTPAYQLAVVVDDADQGVTEVVRGDDLVASTPRQLLLYEALGLRPPAFVHVPLVVGPDGRRLAKRHGDTRLASLRAAGVRAEALLGLLAWSCGWLDRAEPVTAADLLPRYRLDAIPPGPFVLTPGLLEVIGYRPR